jgi:hypothetical protein
MALPIPKQMQIFGSSHNDADDHKHNNGNAIGEHDTGNGNGGHNRNSSINIPQTSNNDSISIRGMRKLYAGNYIISIISYHLTSVGYGIL